MKRLFYYRQAKQQYLKKKPIILIKHCYISELSALHDVNCHFNYRLIKVFMYILDICLEIVLPRNTNSIDHQLRFYVMYK